MHLIVITTARQWNYEQQLKTINYEKEKKFDNRFILAIIKHLTICQYIKIIIAMPYTQTNGQCYLIH